MTRRVQLEAFYPYPPERIWRALTDRDELARWLMENDFEPRVGHTFQFRAKPNPLWAGIVRCQVLEVDPPRRLVYSWLDTWKLYSSDEPTVVTWTLEAIDGGTMLRLEHNGFEGTVGFILSKMLGNGWGAMLRNRIPAVLGHTGARIEVRRIE